MFQIFRYCDKSKLHARNNSQRFNFGKASGHLCFVLLILLLLSLALQPSAGYGLHVSRGFLIKQRRATVGRTPLDE
jgi:hypothetical protein